MFTAQAVQIRTRSYVFVQLTLLANPGATKLGLPYFFPV